MSSVRRKVCNCAAMCMSNVDPSLDRIRSCWVTLMVNALKGLKKAAQLVECSLSPCLQSPAQQKVDKRPLVPGLFLPCFLFADFHVLKSYGPHVLLAIINCNLVIMRWSESSFKLFYQIFCHNNKNSSWYINSNRINIFKSLIQLSFL